MDPNNLGEAGTKKLTDNQPISETEKRLKAERTFVEDNFKEVIEIFDSPLMKRITKNLEEIVESRNLNVSDIPQGITAEKFAYIQGELAGMGFVKLFLNSYKDYAINIKKQQDQADQVANEKAGG